MDEVIDAVTVIKWVGGTVNTTRGEERVVEDCGRHYDGEWNLSLRR
jgi:hypothetical protein